MDLLSQENDLVKTGHERFADSACSWTVESGGQSNAGWRKALLDMSPIKVHHLAMAAVMFSACVLLLLDAFFLNLDLCLEMSSDMKVIDRYTQPSDRYSEFPQVIAVIFAIFLIMIGIVCFYRWFCYPKIPPGIQTSVVHVDAEAPSRCKSIFMNLISMEIENFIIYFFIMMIFALVFASDLYLPEKVLWPNYSLEFRYLENPTFCFIGFGIFGWMKPFIIGFSGGFAMLCAVSMINFYQYYLNLKHYEKVSVCRIREDADRQKHAPLLNVQFSTWSDIEDLGDRRAPQSKAVESVYISSAKVLNNSDTPANDMRV